MGIITPEKVVAIYKEHNENITLDQARLIIDFLQKLAEIELSEILAYDVSNDVNKR